MQRMDITVKRNIKSLFKKVDIKPRLEKLALHMEARPRNMKLWGFDYQIHKDPEKIKKYEMTMQVYFLKEGEQPPTEGRFRRLLRKWKVRNISNPDVSYVISKRTKRKVIKDTQS